MDKCSVHCYWKCIIRLKKYEQPFCHCLCVVNLRKLLIPQARTHKISKWMTDFHFYIETRKLSHVHRLKCVIFLKSLRLSSLTVLFFYNQINTCGAQKWSASYPTRFSALKRRQSLDVKYLICLYDIIWKHAIRFFFSTVSVLYLSCPFSHENCVIYIRIWGFCNNICRSLDSPHKL